jgi:hypothetical protein
MIEYPHSHVGHTDLVEVRKAQEELEASVTLLREVDLVTAVPSRSPNLPKQP